MQYSPTRYQTGDSLVLSAVELCGEEGPVGGWAEERRLHPVVHRLAGPRLHQVVPQVPPEDGVGLPGGGGGGGGAPGEVEAVGGEEAGPDPAPQGGEEAGGGGGHLGTVPQNGGV